jgi:hypothetical protein
LVPLAGQYVRLLEGKSKGRELLAVNQVAARPHCQIRYLSTGPNHALVSFFGKEMGSRGQGKPQRNHSKS